jgi:hypothetical protein
MLVAIALVLLIPGTPILAPDMSCPLQTSKKFFRPIYQNETLVVVMEAAVGVGTIAAMPMVVKNISTKEVRER